MGFVADKPIEITSHDDLASKLVPILHSSFTSLFPDVKNMAFVARPNGVSDDHTDLYYETLNEDNEVTYCKCVAEIKTTKGIDFNVSDVIEE